MVSLKTISMNKYECSPKNIFRLELSGAYSSFMEGLMHDAFLNLEVPLQNKTYAQNSRLA